MTEAIQKSCRHRVPFISHHGNRRILGKGREDCSKELLAIHRGPKIPHVLREYLVEVIEHIESPHMDRHALFLSATNLAAQLSGENLHQIIESRREIKAH